LGISLLIKKPKEGLAKVENSPIISSADYVLYLVQDLFWQEPEKSDKA